MTIFGLIMGFAFLFHTIITVIVFSVTENYYELIRAPIFIFVCVGYVLILSIYSIGKRILRRMGEYNG